MAALLCAAIHGFSPAAPIRVLTATPRRQAVHMKGDLEAAFALFDKDGDGSVSSGELGDVLRSLGKYPSEDEIEDMLNEVDVDKDGLIGYSEFATIMSRDGIQGADAMMRAVVKKELEQSASSSSSSSSGSSSAPTTPAAAARPDDSSDRILAAFSLFDVDGDGKISKLEIGDTMRSIGSYPTDDDLEEMIGVFDRDGDGLINFVEVGARGVAHAAMPPTCPAPSFLCACTSRRRALDPLTNANTSWYLRVPPRRWQFCALMTRRMETNEDEGVDDMVRAAARKVAAQQK